MKLASFGIANFKAFGSKIQHIPIKPITLVFGANSSGKSSLIHSLLWLHHAETCGETDVFNPSLSGKSVDFGGFDASMNQNSGIRRIKFSISIENLEASPDLNRWNDTIAEYKMVLACARTLKDQSPSLIGFDLFANDSKLLTARQRHTTNQKNAGYNVDIEWNHLALLTSVLTDEERLMLKSYFVGIATYEMSCSTFLPTRMFLPLNDHELLESSGSFTKNVSQFLRQELPSMLSEIFSIFSDFITGMQYLPPLRTMPGRGMELRGCTLPGWCWLAKQPELVKRLNTTLQQIKFVHRIQVRRLMPVDVIESSLIAATSEAEAGEVWGALSYGVEHAREEWENFNSKEMHDWAEKHPAFFEEMVTYWKQTVDNNPYFWDNWYEENPDVNTEEAPPDYWLHEESVRLARTFVDDWASDVNSGFYNEAARLYISEHPDVREALASALARQSMKDLIESSVERVELRLFDSEKNVWTELPDVGVGTSQVLPIILEALAQQNKLIAIEQPELHIHPALQAELSDVFIESALGENKNSFLLETHSEHLILRILRRIRETTESDMHDWPEALRKACPAGIRPEDVAVLYVQPGGEGAEIIELPITPDGDFSRPWPDGFFSERSKELF